MPEIFVLDRESEGLMRENNRVLIELNKTLKEIRGIRTNNMMQFALGALSGNLKPPQQVVQEAFTEFENLPKLTQKIEREAENAMERVFYFQDKIEAEMEAGHTDKRYNPLKMYIDQLKIWQEKLEAINQQKNELSAQKARIKEQTDALSMTFKQSGEKTTKETSNGLMTLTKKLGIPMGKIALAMAAINILTKPFKDATNFMKQFTIDRIKGAMSIAMEPLNAVLEMIDAVLAPIFIPFFSKISMAILEKLPEIQALVEKFTPKFEEMANVFVEQVVPAIPTLIEFFLQLTTMNWELMISVITSTMPSLLTLLQNSLIPAIEGISNFIADTRGYAEAAVNILTNILSVGMLRPDLDKERFNYTKNAGEWLGLW